jgi:DNA mismatch endonuclease (patch repair protein)
MRSVGARDTGPELVVRRLLHRGGYRYRLYRHDLPGRPDLVFPSRKKVIFIHGCFWHGHRCSKGKLPKSRPEYWIAKINTNRERDARIITRLKQLGWKSLTVWQCELKQLGAVERTLRKFLGAPGAHH